LSFDPVLAAIRFGCGLSPAQPILPDSDAILAALTGPDRAAEAFPIPRFSEARPSLDDFRNASRMQNAASSEAEKAAALQAYRDERAAGRAVQTAAFGATLARAIVTPDGFRERLTRFWADHFTVRARQGVQRHLVTPFVEEAIRPNLTGSFGDLLVAAATHPMMLLYLDQTVSAGPNSRAAQNGRRGLNENLAREVLELHTLGVDGPYTQADVTEFAKLLAGLSYRPHRGPMFIENMAEPGAEEVLGTRYGGRNPSRADIEDALQDLALHPATVRHIAAKIAVHFVADDPPADLVTALADRYAETGGNLLAVYETLLAHPAAWDPELRKAKQPMGFIQSALRALQVDPNRIVAFDWKEMRRAFHRPMRIMGQVWEEPVGPDGWSERAEDWITPQGMSERITWALTAPELLMEALPDPRLFVHHALGPVPPEPVVFAASAAESRADGVGVILASAAFQRR